MSARPLILARAILRRAGDYRDSLARVAELKGFPSRYPLVNPTPRRGEPTAARADKQRRIDALWEFEA